MVECFVKPGILVYVEFGQMHGLAKSSCIKLNNISKH